MGAGSHALAAKKSASKKPSKTIDTPNLKSTKLANYNISVDSKLNLMRSPGTLRKTFPYMVMDKLSKEIAYIEFNDLKPSACEKELAALKKRKIKVSFKKVNKGNIAYCQFSYKSKQLESHIVQRFYFQKKNKNSLSVTTTNRMGKEKSAMALVNGIKIK